MGKAEVGSTKYLSNKMKQKGLTRLRWYCQICEKACRDENAYKMHTQSESHTRKALLVAQNFKGVEEDYSKQFLNDFIQQLKTAHGEKEIQINRFYQEVIARRDHTHLNATKWHSLTDFAKYLGREGICRVTDKDGDDGIFIAWIDDSPEALRRRQALMRKEMQDRGDEEREQALLKAQIKRAQADAKARGVAVDDDGDSEEQKARELKRQEGEKISLSLGAKRAAAKKDEVAPKQASSQSPTTEAEKSDSAERTEGESSAGGEKDAAVEKGAEGSTGSKPLSLKFGAKPQPKNVFRNAFSGGAKKVMAAQPKKMSEAERIMKEEIERKRAREAGGPPSKRARF